MMVKVKLAPFAAIISAGLLSACMGSDLGQNDGTSDAWESSWESFDDLEKRADSRAPSTDLPTTGSASYDGMGFMTLSGDDEGLKVLADVAMNADFQSQKIDGTVDNFIDEESGRYFDGSVKVAGGIDRTTDTFSADGQGTLSSGSQEGQVDMQLTNGTFTGDSAEAVTGRIGGTADFDGNTSDISGRFYAEQ